MTIANTIEYYRDLFEDVRSYEYFKELHVGLISELPRKSLPAISKAVGEENSQGLHHFVSQGDLRAEGLREARLSLSNKCLVSVNLYCVSMKRGTRRRATQPITQPVNTSATWGKLENGIVSVNAYRVLDNITFPLLFKTYKTEKRLQAGDVYKSKPALAIELIQELQQRSFQFDLVLADRLYGESSDFITELMKLKMHFVVAIRDNHAVWVAKSPVNAKRAGSPLSVSLVTVRHKPAISLKPSSASVA